MGYDLVSKTAGDFRFNQFAWPKALDLAKLYDWQPQGTRINVEFLRHLAREEGVDPTTLIAERIVAFDGSYYSNDGQIVTAADALNLALALEKALDDIPDRLDFDKTCKLTASDAEAAGLHYVADVIRQATAQFAQETGEEVEAGFPLDPRLNPIEYFGGDEKGILTDFIDYCRCGEFAIF